MDTKRRYIELVQKWKSEYPIFENGQKLTNSELAKKLNISREHFQRLISENYPVEEQHLVDLETRYRDWEHGAESDMDKVAKSVRKPKIETNPETEGITFIPISAQAGYYRKIVDPMFKSSLQKIFIPGMPYRGENYRIWEVEGNSMEPTFKEHFYLLTERVEQQFWKQAKNFHAYVIVTEDDVLLKRVFRKDATTWVLISDNEELYPQFPLEVSEIKELWFVRRKMDWEMSPPKRFEIKI